MHSKCIHRSGKKHFPTHSMRQYYSDDKTRCQLFCRILLNFAPSSICSWRIPCFASLTGKLQKWYCVHIISFYQAVHDFSVLILMIFTWITWLKWLLTRFSTVKLLSPILYFKTVFFCILFYLFIFNLNFF